MNLVSITSNWQGWMLSQTVKDCFMKFCRKDTKSNPFKLEVASFRGTDQFVLVGISWHFLRDLYVLVKDAWFLLCTQKE